ncbi:LptF/LptG family permease [Sulfurospirillum sp. 1307]
MNRVNNYLLKQFSSIFSSLFFTLFFITSIIFFIKIANITSVIKITFVELGILYLYLIPNILIYTLPVTFFIAVCISLFNLSKENEIIVLFTLSHSPRKIAKLFTTVSFILTTLLIINIIVLIPTAKQLNANFIDYKKVEAKFNIKATEFGQKFSNWLVYINKSDKKGTYDSVVMYQADKKNDPEKLITAKKANIKNKKGILQLELDDGRAFQIEKDKIEQLDFKKMYLYNETREYVSEVKSIKDYWLAALKYPKRAYDLAFFLLIALFPLATALFAVSIGIVTYRYEKKGIYPSMALVIMAYMIPGFIMIKYWNLIGLIILFSSFMTLSYLYYKRKILTRY